MTVAKDALLAGGFTYRADQSDIAVGQIYFGSREAHGLTYTSCQESHDRLFRRIAAELGTSEAAVRWALKRPGGFFS
jgi:hypothetical protein